MADMTYIKLFIDYLDAIEPLGDAERGRLFTSLLIYARTGEAPQLGGNERFLFPMMRAQIDRDNSAMDSLSDARSEAGRKGAEAKQAKTKTQTKTKTKTKTKTIARRSLNCFGRHIPEKSESRPQRKHFPRFLCRLKRLSMPSTVRKTANSGAGITVNTSQTQPHG